jgi:hypothetical protein
MTKQYEERDIIALDRASGYYIRHVGATNRHINELLEVWSRK